MSRESNIKYFTEIKVKKPSEIIIKQIKDLISSGVLKVGDRLPSERSLSERFKVGRGHVREALRKLEFCGILRTNAQSGTVVANIGENALRGLIENVFELEENDLESLMEARAVLEVYSAQLAAERANELQKEELKKSHEEFRIKVNNGEWGLEEDILFHLKITEICGNSVFRTMIGLIAPDIISMSIERGSCREGRANITLQEHEKILQAIINSDSNAASIAMQEHMNESLVSMVRSVPSCAVKNTIYVEKAFLK